MTAAEFWAAQPGGGVATTAAYLVLVNGLGIRAAARQAGVDPGAVSRACKTIRAAVAGHCPECGQSLTSSPRLKPGDSEPSRVRLLP